MKRTHAMMLAALLAAAWTGESVAAAELPRTLDMKPLRAVIVQADGHYPPLDTVARDVVESVTGDPVYAGHDPVLMLLAWTFDPQSWVDEPLITIGNAELRHELKLPATQSVFSYSQLVGHQPLMNQIDALAHRMSRGKLDPLESKVSKIHEKLNVLHSAFGGYAIVPIPDPKEGGAPWTSIGEMLVAGAPQHQAVRTAWEALRIAFLKDNKAAFAQAAGEFKSALDALPAGYRPSAQRIRTELLSNRLQPFATAWKIMAVGAVLAAVAVFARRKAFDVIAVVALLAGFLALSYGLYLRWQIAGRIPAANMFESLLFLSWGMGAFAIVSMLVVRDRVVPLTASAMGALALFLAVVLPLDSYIRPIPPVLRDTVWMSIHVPVIMVSYSVLALAMLIAHAQMVVMAAAPARRKWISAIDQTHYWYIHVGSILLFAGIATGSMWAASSWGRYWGWDPKEVWSLVALLAYLTIMHVRVDRQVLPGWARAIGSVLLVAVFALIIPKLAPITPLKLAGLVGAAVAVMFFVSVRGEFATALKSVVAFWTIIMTYLGVNYVLGIGLHSYGFGTGAVVHYMML
ncbi:MAG: cytochrome c biogenesis protein CcsA, partial [Phycisphaerales bacterium]|nr:cytochrome c biogenesis protein CcsA [Phycisphaerales bacterium]